MKIYTIIIYFFTTSLFAQEFAFNNLVQDNLMLYRIKYFIDEDTNFCIGDFQSEIQSYLLKNDEEFDVVYLPIDELEYPNKNVQLYIAFNNYYSKRIKDSNGRSTVFNHSQDLLHSLMKKNLVGHNVLTDELIFISGNVFKSCIKNDFSIDKETPATFFKFLKFKLFNYEVTEIKFQKNEKEHLLFEASSSLTKETLYIRVSIYDYDNIQVKTKESNWTERGNFRWID